MSTKSIRAVERAVEVLDFIRTAGGSASVSEISEGIDLPKSTVHRVLVALTRTGILSQDSASGKYAFGQKLFELVFTSSKQWDLVSIAQPYLERLRDSLNETVTLAVSIGWTHSDIAYALSHSPLCWTPRLGERYPLHWGAAGKVLLAFAPSDEFEEYLRTQPLSAATERTITDAAALREEKQRIRDAGFAVSCGEHEPGALAVAAAIRDAEGYACAAVCVQGPELRMRQLDLPAVGAQVAMFCREIEGACRLAGMSGRRRRPAS